MKKKTSKRTLKSKTAPRSKKPTPATKPIPTDSSKESPIRLNRYLAMLGAGSRRRCDEMILAGRVTVDGQRIKDPSVRVKPGATRVTIDKAPLGQPQNALVLVLNKPTGVVSTVSDPFGRPTVIDLCGKYSRRKRLFPVGRLDVNTTGLILLTNDGELCYRLTHPRFQIPRTYHVRVRGTMSERKLIGLQKLVSAPSKSHDVRPSVELLKELPRESVLKITLREGRNRQVRRMCESFGLRVVKLRRVRFGPLTIRKLPMGSVRPLEKSEMERLWRHIGDQKGK